MAIEICAKLVLKPLTAKKWLLYFSPVFCSFSVDYIENFSSAAVYHYLFEGYEAFEYQTDPDLLTRLKIRVQKIELSHLSFVHINNYSYVILVYV